LLVIAVTILLQLLQLNVWMVVMVSMIWLPSVSATSATAFPDIPFATFSQLIQEQFGPHVTLTTVLVILLSLTSNTDLLNLHARQKHPSEDGEITQRVSGWMKAFVWSLQSHLGNATDTLFKPSENMLGLSQDARITNIGRKLDSLVDGLHLTPYTHEGQRNGWLGKISGITPVRLLCPNTAECPTPHCRRALHQVIREKNISHVTLCEGTTVHHQVALLTGGCTMCQVQSTMPQS
jgi:hypothetical protein